jgi:hypothetical protein
MAIQDKKTKKQQKQPQTTKFSAPQLNNVPSKGKL